MLLDKNIYEKIFSADGRGFASDCILNGYLMLPFNRHSFPSATSEYSHVIISSPKEVARLKKAIQSNVVIQVTLISN